MHKYRNQIIGSLIFMLAVVIGVIVFFNARDLAKKLGEFPLWIFIPVIALKWVNWALRYFEWQYFLRVIGVKATLRGETRPATETQPATVKIRDSFILWMASLPLALSPGKAAEVVKALVFKNMTGVPASRTVPIIIAERLVDGIAVVLLVMVSALIGGSKLFNSDAVNQGYVQALIVFSILFMVAVILVVQVRSLAMTLIHLIARLPFIGRFQHSLLVIYESSYEMARLRHIARTVGFGIGAYFCDCVGFYLMLLGLGEKASAELFTQAVFILGFSVVVSALSALPGGAGGREFTIGAMLTGIVAMEKSAIGAAVLMIGIFQVWFGVLVGIVLALIFRKHLFPPSLEAEIQAYERHKEEHTPVLA
ncbi:MAG: flippase-like domain-containing protein [Chloroflexi bacterium]|nr:flippase-like domain-containing protein [Chloroflexota bacterium]